MPNASDSRSALSPDLIKQLLDLLSTDDAFRARFAAAPSEALASIGAGEDVTEPCCDPLDVLASKEEFAALRQQLAQKLEHKTPFLVPFCFEAGRAASELSREA